METSTRVRVFTHRYVPVENVGTVHRSGGKRSTTTPSPKVLKGKALGKRRTAKRGALSHTTMCAVQNQYAYNK